ncbi:ABC transporter ATP-binding protein [Paenibacillus lutrae]|uniref:ATP-binding cassette domain-containing protein n=1 Tax=Paenibacillus lutrae TaxID=2078573 RepID=A0A7X3FLL8_9BACL|nr:ATP-binding cassette domain-containing protein [Paenibacillus lutrae]MVP01963.1 ATP-binding cassette domain-containing protein [Paenibacillus lutrae]
MGIIQVNDLSKSFKVLNRRQGLSGAFKDLFSGDYRMVHAVKGISLEVEEGEIVGFMGPNGAGKSTTIKMMTGVLEPTEGSIMVNGQIPYKNRTRNMQQIGVVFGQRSQLWWDLPVIESLNILKEIYKVDQKSFDENMDTFNEVLNLNKLHATPVRFLSLGQRMLCDIAASFLHNPKVIFLDEPTIGLDVSIKNKIRNVIKKLNEIKKTTIILTTHDLSDIEALCKRIVIIDKGTIIYDGGIQAVSRSFGAFRTLKLECTENDPDLHLQIAEKVQANFGAKTTIPVVKADDYWISLTINQDEVKLMEVLNFVISHFQVKDIKIEEVDIEQIIRNIYEGGVS